MKPEAESPPETPAEAPTGEGLASPPCSALFDIPETLSPRLEWEQAHEVATHHNPAEKEPWIAVSMTVCKDRLDGYDLTKDEQTNIGALFAGYCRLLDDGDMIGYGQTRDDAVDDLVRRGVIEPLESIPQNADLSDRDHE